MSCLYMASYDGRLRACPSCLLGLMYVLRWLYVIRCLGFQLVGGCIKSQAFPFFFLVFLKFFCQKSFLHNQIGFLDVHDNYCTTIVYIHYMLLNVESGRFLLALSSWISFIGVIVADVVATKITAGVVVVVAATRGNLCCYTSTNQQSRDLEVGFKSLFLFLSHAQRHRRSREDF